MLFGPPHDPASGVHFFPSVGMLAFPRDWRSFLVAFRHVPAYKLSGGERRRLEITRALVTSPKFMLLDEPFAGVDPIAVNDIQTIVAGLRRRGIGVLITDHNVRETLSITNRAYVMYEGKVLLSGSATDLAENPEAREIYLGERFTL